MNDGQDDQGLGFELVQKQLKPSWIYQLPDNPTMCHRFTINSHGKTHMTLVCNACHNVRTAARKRKQNGPAPPRCRKAKGNSMENDPLSEHIEGCEPVPYLKTMAHYETVHEELTAQQSPYDFPLVKVVCRNAYAILHRWTDDPTKCYRFRYVKSTLTNISLFCSKCYSLYMKQKVTQPSYHDGFVDNPRLHHHPGCEPLSYEEIMITHSIVDKLATKKHFMAWCGKKDKNLLDDPNIENESTLTPDNYLIAPGMEIVESRMPLTYIYRIPEGKCFRFTISTFTLSNTGLQCAGCRIIFKREKRKDSPKTRMSDGFSMRDDPTLNHFQGCVPEQFAETVAHFRMVPVKTDSQGIYDFRLVAMQKPGIVSVIHRLQDDPTKCYRFTIQRKHKTSSVSLRCSSCCIFINQNRKNKSSTSAVVSHSYYANDTGFLTNPLLGHTSGCQPSCHKEVMRTNDHVELSRARNIIKGIADPGNFKVEHENTPTGFPVLVMQKRNALTFIYRNPSNLSQGYQFSQLRHNDSSNLVCSTCCSADNYKMSSSVVVRKSDGLSMETDPVKRHLNGCKPPLYNLMALRIKPEDNESNTDPAYRFRLETRALQEKFSVAYRLNENGTRCYLFQSFRYIKTMGQLQVTCRECQSISCKKWKTTKEKAAWKLSQPKYRCTAAGFIDDPTLGHIVGCEPLRFEDIMETHMEAEKEDSINFLRYNHAGMDKDRKKVLSRKGKRRGPRASNDDEELSDMSFDQSEATSTRNISHSPTQDEYVQDDDLNIEEPIVDLGRNEAENEADIEEDVPLSQMVQVTSNISDAESEINTNNGLEDEVDAVEEMNKVTASRTIPITQSKVFSRVFETPFFTEDEFKVSVKDRRVVVLLERDVSAVGIEGCFLRYSVEMPPSVDISTIQAIWNEGTITLRANALNH